jgi:hypothetical protein
LDGLRFDGWTRRRFGVAAGGALAALIGAGGSRHAGADKKGKQRKKRCLKLGAPCRPGGKRKCCHRRACEQVAMEDDPQTYCCKDNAAKCGRDEDCCGFSECDPVEKICVGLFSDRNRKANFGSVDPDDMLRRVRELPIATWTYTSDDPAVRHIGPMAQDFVALFGVGADDRHIHPLDGHGVALAAIQGLLVEVEVLRAENARLSSRLTILEQST